MILGTYIEAKIPKYLSDFFDCIKDFLEIDKKTQLYWCLPMNNIYQAVLNSYMVMPFQPLMLRLFESNNFYAIDHIKYIRYLKGDKNLTISDLFVIEHEDAIRYIVTNPTDNFIDIPLDLAPRKSDLFENFYESNGYKEHFLDIVDSFRFSLLDNEINLNKNIKIPKILISHKNFWLSNKEFLSFKYYCLPICYIIGAKYLRHSMTLPQILKTHTLSSIFYLSLDYSDFLTWEFDNIQEFYDGYQGYYNVVFDEILGYKNIKPNEFCPCGSGLKYKKCCMKKGDLAYCYLTNN